MYVATCLAASAWSEDLTGNWAVRQDQHDGTERRTYFDLKENGGHITGHIRVTQFYYAIKESTGGADGFTIVGSMIDVDKNSANLPVFVAAFSCIGAVSTR